MTPTGHLSSLVCLSPTSEHNVNTITLWSHPDLTDGEGWTYGTSFEHIPHSRPGGRACKRATDRVRQRQWQFAEMVVPDFESTR